MRPLTKLEKERMNLPDCPTDPSRIGGCRNHVFPPTDRECRNCMLEAIQQAINMDHGADAWNGVLALSFFYEKKIGPEGFDETIEVS